MFSPTYFFALFGDPNPPEKDTIESGLYHPHPDTAPFPTKPGDVLLLYCAASYQKYPLQIPGIGVILKLDEKVINYRYLPFAEPIPKYRIDKDSHQMTQASSRILGSTGSGCSRFPEIRLSVWSESRESYGHSRPRPRKDAKRNTPLCSLPTNNINPSTLSGSAPLSMKV